MGTYCAIKFDDIDITSAKSVIPDFFVSLFQEGDRRVTRDPDYEHDDINYVASRAVILRRLDLQGFTSEAARTSFERWRRDEIDRYTEYAAEEGFGDDELTLLNRFTFDEWRSRLRSALKYRYESENATDDKIDAKMRDTQEHWLMWVADERLVIRAMLDELSEVQEVKLDSAGLIANGYVDGAAGLLDRSRAEAALTRPILGPIVIIGEGVSDTVVLRESLSALYSEMKDYFSFFDHSELSVDGGASYLVKFLRAFGAARIATRLIAVFDNDAAGCDAYREASMLNLPENIAPLKLPDTDLARAYPTIGPQGAHIVNVNGGGAGIELYLGRHNLTNAAGELTPVHWSGPVGKAKNYQGVIRNKNEVVEKFLKELRVSRSADACRLLYPELVAVWLEIFATLRALNAADVVREDEKVQDLF